MNRLLQIEIPGYRIERILGKGGMATVYLATQMSLGRPVALKVLHDPETPQFFERFLNEGRCIARLNHSNLIAIYDIGQGDGFYYIAMEYLPGGDLKSHIVQGIKPNQAIRILMRLAGCLSYVHNEGVIHRDIKPSNILFRNDGTLVLTDFGIAKLIQADNDLTVTGTVMGSPHYLSPELAQGNRRVDGRSDLYALGIILYEMLTGRKPYTADSFAATLMAHIQKPLPRLPEQFAELQPILDRLLAKKPQDRFQNGAELVMKLQPLRNRFKQGGPQGPASAQPEAKVQTQALDAAGRGTPRPLRRLAYAALAAVALGAWLAYQRSGEVPTASTDTTQERARNTPQAIVAPAGSIRERETVTTTAPPPIVQSDPGDEDKTISQPTTVPEAKPAVETDPLAALLRKADQRFASNRLSYPPDNSARFYFNAVLQLDPDNRAAQLGLDRIADRYADLARSQLERGQHIKARHFASRGLKVRPQHERLIRLINQLNRPAPAAQPGDIFDYLTPDNDR